MTANTLQISDTSNASVLTGHTDWRSAVDALLTYWTSKNRPFSSGEVAAALREHRPDLRFSVLAVGEYLRDLFYSGNMPEYVDLNTGMFAGAIQVPRYTEGLYPDRTPAGIQVFVYAPDPDSGEKHAFEVFIPRPGETQADAPMAATPQSAQAAQDATGKTKTPVAIFGAKVAVNKIVISVHADGRMAFNRTALEAAIALSGKPMRGGDPVWVVQTDTVLTVYTSDPNVPDAKVYNLARERGRIHIPSQDPVKPFVPGKTYTVEIGSGTMTVVL